MKQNEVKIGATSNLDRKNAAEKGAEFINNMIHTNGWNQRLTKAQKKSVKKMAKELLKAGRITEDVHQAILNQLAKQ